MKFTIEENREALKRWGHIPPAPLLRSARCSARCPGSARSCTRTKNHRGPHVAHGIFRRVVAVWDMGLKDPGSSARRSVKRRGKAAGTYLGSAPRDPGAVASLGRLWRRISRLAPSMEGALLIILCLGMVLFAIDTALRIVGWR